MTVLENETINQKLNGDLFWKVKESLMVDISKIIRNNVEFNLLLKVKDSTYGEVSRSVFSYNIKLSSTLESLNNYEYCI